MKCSTKHALRALLLCAAAAFVPTQSGAEDIDIFVGASAGAAAFPKILIVLDNTSNWSRASQKWPGGLTQGQAEAHAINTILGTIGSNVNLGLMEFVTGGNANDDGGFIRQAVVPMTSANKTAFSTQLTTIYNNITSPNEKKNANTPYGDLMYDAYNYFNGGNCFSPSAVVASEADSNGYTTNYTRFKSPLSDANACGQNFIIFIGNPNASGPSADSAANGTALTNLGGSVSPQLQVPAFSSATQNIPTNLGFTSQCFASQSACTTTDFATQCAAGAGFDSCSCSNTLTTTSLDTCLAGTQRFSVIGNTISGGTTSSVTTTATITNPTKGVTGCYASSAAATAAGDHGGLSLPAGTTTTSGSTSTTTTNSGGTYTVSASQSTTATQNCAATAGAAVLGSNQITTRTGTTATCYGGLGTGNPKWNGSGDFAGVDTSCPAPLITTSGNSTTTTTYICAVTGAVGAATGCSGSKNKINVTNTITGSPSTVTTSPNYKFDVTQTYTQQSVATTTTSGSTTSTTALGNTSLCYASCSTAEFAACSTYNGGCTCAAPTASAGLCPSGARYMVTGNVTGTVVTPTGTFITPSTAANADEWAKFMHHPNAINPVGGNTIKQAITTYTIDVFNAQQNAEETELYMSMARAGGGKYFSATNEAAIVTALEKILTEIQSVNSTFASASLPVNATNRTQNANQVFIGMFRPDPDANPRWYGNLKQYAIGKVGGDLDLVDVNGAPATNALTGFIDDCAVSFWTTNSIWPTNSSNYWANITDNPDPASNCNATTVASLSGARYSDLPDGPTVEKGAVAEVLRKGNNPGATPTWTTANRTVLTLSGSALVPFNTINVASTTLGGNILNFTRGVDVINTDPPPSDAGNNTGLYNASTNPNQTRPSIHGDVVHSRPLPVNYGDAGVTVYYGANDGTLRAVNAGKYNADGTLDTSAGQPGKERWAYVAPEHYTKLQRLMDNNPGVDYKIGTSGTTPKDYFFDGSIGIFQAATGSPQPVWIYPTQRRGGRMVYGFDVSVPTSNPLLKWRVGCPNLTDDVGCMNATAASTDFVQMGQTWSTPNVAFINGYSTPTTKPVVVVGGGYDSCEDINVGDTDSSFNCSATKGNAIYFIDAEHGTLITSFKTLRGVAADVTMIDVNNDGLVDYAYVVDTGGNIYRVDFVSSPDPKIMTALPCTPTCTHDNKTDTTHWFMHKVAYTNGASRKFLFAPGLFPSGSSTFLAVVSGDREHPLSDNYPFTTPAATGVVNRAYIYKDDLTSTSSTAAVNLDVGCTDPNNPSPGCMLNVTDATTSTCTSNNLLSSTGSSASGWFMDLTANGKGEQGVTSAVIVGGMTTFSTNRPIVNTMSCGTRLGEARGYFVNLFNGSGAISTANNASCGGVRSSVFAGGGLPPSPVFGIVPINNVPTAVLIGAIQRDGTTSSPIKPSKITPPIDQTRRRTYKYIKGVD